MYGAITALIIALMMITLVICKGNSIRFEKTMYCKKSELGSFADGLPDNCIIEIRIGRNTYDARRNTDASRRDL